MKDIPKFWYRKNLLRRYPCVIFDTNILSELTKLEPDSSVVSWVSIQSIASVFTTTISQAEILYGIALLSGINALNK